MVERRADTYQRRNAVKADALGTGMRAHRDGKAAVRAERVRLVCRRCRAKLDQLRDIEGAYGRRYSLSRGHEVPPQPRKTWRCGCGGNYPVTMERMKVEYAAAIERGDRVIELPLAKL